MAYRTDGTANFNFFINRQGPRGPQGIQGPEGFSPNVQVEEDQGNTFTLRVTNKDNFFITSNLREHKEDRGGDYIRYDRAGQLMYIGDPNFATTVKAGEVRLSTVDDLTTGSDTVALTPKVYKDDVTSRIEEVNQTISTLDNTNVKLTGNQTVAGIKTFTDGIVADRVSLSNGNRVLRPDAGRLKIGSTSNTAGTILEGPYVEVKGTNVDIYGKFTAHGLADFNYNATFYQDAIIKGSAKDDNNHLYLKQNTITAGDNVQIVNTADGIKISSTAHDNTVTTDTAQTITGLKTFAGADAQKIFMEGDTCIIGTRKNIDSLPSNILARFYDPDGTKSTCIGASSDNILALYGQSIVDKNNKKFLVQGSITAGDNVTIEETTDGVKISSTGGGSSEPPANMVTTDTNQNITGFKAFNGFSNTGLFNVRDTSDPSQRFTTNFLNDGVELAIVNKNNEELAFGVNTTNAWFKPFYKCSNFYINNYADNSAENGIAANIVLSGVIKNKVNNVTSNVLTQKNVTAGSDNLAITDTEDGVQITCYAPTNAQIEALQRLINDLSTKIDNLTNRVRDLETQIDGGIA